MKYRFVIFLATAVILYAGQGQFANAASQFVGLWQFPDRQVWIQIDADGSVFQCRIAQNNVVIKSDGSFVAPDKIIWNQIWDEDTLLLEGNILTFSGKYGDFNFAPATDSMHCSCKSSD